MSNQPCLKRKRTVTVCGECHRRKQKCDHERPCQNCVARNVPEKCFYGDAEPATAGAFVREENCPGLEEQDQGQDYGDYVAAKPGLLDQIGYSLFNENNSFHGLQMSSNSNVGRAAGPTLPRAKSALQANFDDRLRQLVDKLPNEPVANELVEIYFSEANWWFMVLERYYFDKIYVSWAAASAAVTEPGTLQRLPRDLQYFPALLFQILAVAIQFLPPNTASARALQLKNFPDCDMLSQKYSEIGVEIMALLGRTSPTITAIHHDLMRATWLKNNSRGSESWHSVGNAIRQAQDLGVHLQSDIEQSPEETIEEFLERLWYDEYRRRLWARLFVLDSHMAHVLGRPRHINRDDCTARPPVDCDIPDDPSKTVPMPPGRHQPPSSFSFMIFLYAISHKIHDLLSSGAGKPHFKDYQKVKVIHDQVTSILDELPPAVRPQNPDTSWDIRKPHFPKIRQQIASTANSFLLGLHRPHVNIHAASREAAIQAALNSLEAQQRLFKLMSQNQYKIYGFSFYTIDAGMFLLSITMDQPPNDHLLLDRVQHALQQAIGRLALLKTRSAVAESGEQILSQCYLKIQEHTRNCPDDFNRTTHVISIPAFPEMPDLQQMANSADSYNIPAPQNPLYSSMSDLFDVGNTYLDQSGESVLFDMFMDPRGL